MQAYDIAVLTVYMVVLLVYGLWNNTQPKDIQEYAIAGKRYGAPTVFLTIAATFIGGGFTIGNAGHTYAYGLVTAFSFLGISSKEFFVARFVAPHIHKFPGAISIGDIMVANYGKVGKVVTGLSGFIVSIGIVAGQIVALSKIFEEFFGLSAEWSIIIGMSIVTFYSAIGGMVAVVRTDIIQFFVLFVGILSVLVFALLEVGSLETALANIPADKTTFLGDKTLLAFAALVLFWFIGETLTPAYFSRLLISRNFDQVIKASYGVGVFSTLFIFLPASIGLLGYSLDLVVGDNPDVVFPQIVNLVLPWWWKPIVLAAILSVIMSSSDSFLNSGAVTFVHDFLKPILPENAIKNELRLLKIVTLAGGLLTILFTLSGGSVITILGQSYLFWAPIVLVPLLLSIWGVPSSPKTFVIASIISALAVVGLYKFTALGEFNSVVGGFLTSIAAYGVLGRLAGPGAKDTLP